MNYMLRSCAIISILLLLIALPFLFRRDQLHDAWQPGDPMLIIITPHNEAIRTEFATAFSNWHQTQFGTPVRIDWRSIGGTTEIMRYLESEFAAAFKPWATRNGLDGTSQTVLAAFNPRFQPDQLPHDASLAQQQQAAAWNAFRTNDNHKWFGASIDLFFGGGTYDHGIAARKGFTVPPWTPNQYPEHLFITNNVERIPEWVAGERWRSDTFFGTCISTFGICSNRDRLQDLGITSPPRAWRDLTDPRLFRQIGVADPTKSGSIAKAFEMIIQQECHTALQEAGFSHAQIDDFEHKIHAARLPPGVMPSGIPDSYQTTMEQGWQNGLNVIRMIGANARYFTDAAGKVPIDVSNGDAAAGVVIDFYGRYQAEFARDTTGASRLDYFTPIGGSSVSADPISLLRGAPHRELAVRFIEFTLSPAGQRLWNYRPGTPGGPHKFALRRLPIRRDFYPSTEFPDIQATHATHLQHASDDLAAPSIDPYQLSQTFTYYPRWTSGHFGVHRMLIRAMAMDSGSELQQAWQSLLNQSTSPITLANLPPELQKLPDIPEPLTWSSATDLYRNHDRLELMRIWTRFFRHAYQQVAGIDTATSGRTPNE